MDIKLDKSQIKNRQSKIKITGSKSESNRLLLLQALYPEIHIENLSNSDDTQLMHQALNSHDSLIDIHHAGTAMRFLTAFFATQKNREVTITGSKRMKERPIKILVNALKELGADIEYLDNVGFPPLKIKGKKLKGGKVNLEANISSQYISALLLIAPTLKKGLKLKLKGKITSIPYIKMTLNLLNQIGVKTNFKENTIQVKPSVKKTNLKIRGLVESDWSSASYYYSIVALGEVGAQIRLSSYKEDSLQGDSILANIYNRFGVTTNFDNNDIILKKETLVLKPVSLNLQNAPDIAQTIAVTCLGLGLECYLTGLHTLKIKETDRLTALKTEIEKLGGKVTITDESLHLLESEELNNNIAIKTYNDHRMAMAFSPLALKIPININNADVVSKSYPDFWSDLESIGFSINK